MSQSSGAYGEADATEQKNEQHNNQPANSASTDATLSARAKSPKSKGPPEFLLLPLVVRSDRYPHRIPTRLYLSELRESDRYSPV